MERWRIDPDFSAVTFSIPKMGANSPRGTFQKWDGTFTTDDGSWLSARVELRIDVASLTTADPISTAEALSARFLDVERFPQIRFVSREVESVEDARVLIAGDLTIKDITHPLRVKVEFVGRARDLAGDDRMGWEINGEVSRSDYALQWHPTLENVAGFIIGDIIVIAGELEFTREL